MPSSQLPEAFVRQMQAQLGSEYAVFADALTTMPPVSILKNPFKPADLQLPPGTEVPWCPQGVYLAERPSFTHDPLFHAGCYYVMEASSMLLWQVLTSLDLHVGTQRVLDLCAAPGGKTAVMLSRLSQDSILVSNEVAPARAKVLHYNIAKWGVANAATMQMDPSRISLDGYFDCVLVDAPCSGEGLFRKDPKAIIHWSPEHVRHCSARQKRILSEALRLLRPGGHLIYSTCTYNGAENIDQLDWLAAQHGMTSPDIQMPTNWGVQTVRGTHATGFQSYPHHVRGEGFFIGVLRLDDGHKKSPNFKSTGSLKTRSKINWNAWIDIDAVRPVSPAPGVWRAVSPTLFEANRRTGLDRVAKVGTLIGREKRDVLIPEHSLALSIHRSGDIPRIDINLEQAMAYLRREQIAESKPDPQETMHGGGHSNIGTANWRMACFKGMPIGWLKQTEKGLKNSLPMGLRVRD